MVLRWRLFVLDIERSNDLARVDCGNEGGLVDQRAPRGIDKNGALLHSRNVLGADDAAASRRQDRVNGYGVGISHELRFVDEAGAWARAWRATP